MIKIGDSWGDEGGRGQGVLVLHCRLDWVFNENL